MTRRQGIRMKKSVVNLVKEVNELCAFVKDKGMHVVCYDGGTYPSIIDVESVEIKNQFVYIKENESTNGYGFEKRYNTNKLDEYAIGGMTELMYHLRLIRKEYKKAFKYYTNNVA
tara:strand:- start:100 stop:444 length:345 start_codon:yes stop_codon:yes gene_type:complete